MPIAVVTIETHGFPASLAAADAMVKAGRVTLIKIAPADSGHQYVVVRGPNAEVKRALEAGLRAANACYGDGAYAHTLIPRPTANVISTLELDFTEDSMPFAESTGLVPPQS
ncbi:MAG: carbon dioxide-concentrating mechanism protein CcmK [Cyanobacteria bacterium P01_D01_bin.105]